MVVINYCPLCGREVYPCSVGEERKRLPCKHEARVSKWDGLLVFRLGERWESPHKYCYVCGHELEKGWVDGAGNFHPGEWKNFPQTYPAKRCFYCHQEEVSPRPNLQATFWGD